MAALILFHVQGPDMQPIGGATLEATSPNGDWVGTTNACGDFPARLAAGHYDVVVSHSGFADRALPMDLADSGIVTIGLERPNLPVGADIGRLHADGLVLRRADGSAWFGLGITAFPLLQYWMDGNPKVGPFLDYCQAHGLIPRLTGSYESLAGLGLGSFHPYQYGLGRVQAALVAVFGDLARRGLRGKFDACCDVQNGSLDGHAPKDFFAACVDALSGVDNAEISGGNEETKNGYDSQTFSRPTNVLASRGSRQMDELPPLNPWSLFEFHIPRNDTWPKSAKAVYDIQVGQTTEGVALKVPGSISETIGIGPVDEPGKTTSNADDVFDFVAAPFGSYIVLHVRSGATLDVPGQVANACVEAAQLAASLMPVEFREGQYVRNGLGLGLIDSPLGPDGEPLWYLRSYGRQRGDEQWIAILRPTAANRVEPAPGWVVVDELGPRGNIVHVRRQ